MKCPVAALWLISLTALATPVTAAEPECELHIWPSNSTSAVTAGILSNFGMIGAYADLQSNRDATLHNQAALIEALPPVKQAQSMVAMDLPSLIGMGSARLVFQSGPIDPRRAPKRLGRLSNSSATCYAELIVSLNEFRDSAVRGASLKSEFTFRDFRGGAMKIVAHKTANGVKDFPARSAEGEARARQAVSEAFTANLADFARRAKARGR